ncbi:hypothetical protein D9M71_356050 [compost metagenome]
MGTEFAVLRQFLVQRQHADTFGGGMEIEQRILTAAVRRRVHPGGDAELIVDLHRLASGLEHGLRAGRRNPVTHHVPAGFGKVAVRSEVRFMADVTAFLFRQALDQRRVDVQAFEHRVVGPTGVPVDATEDNRLIRPASLVEHLAQFTAFLPVSRTDPGHADHITGACASSLVFLDQPVLQFRQGFDLVQQVGFHAVESAHHRVAVGVDHAWHQHLARQVDALGLGIGQGIDFGIAAHFQNLAVLHRNSLHQRLAGFGGKDLAVEQHQVSGGHRLYRGQCQRGGQQVWNESHWNAL